MQESRWGLTREEQSGRITSLDLLAILLLMQPRMRLAFCAASAHCCLTSSFSSSNTPKTILAGMLLTSVLIAEIASIPVHDPALGLVELHEVHTGPLLRLVQVPLDGVQVPLEGISFPQACQPSSLVSSANLLRVHLIPLPTS